MRPRYAAAPLLIPFIVVLLGWSAQVRTRARHAELFTPSHGSFDEIISGNQSALMENGRQVFRYDTFGDEAFWSDTLKLHEAIAGNKAGGIGGGVGPATALGVGLKVDIDKVPPPVLAALKRNAVDLNDPANTLALIDAQAVVGVVPAPGRSARQGIGITCALCHSTVDDSFAHGIGHRLDGWPNRDLNVGGIVNLAPDLSAVATLLQVDQPTVRAVLQSWGPGRFDAELFLDGKAFRPDGRTAATLIPPAFGLAGVNLHTYTAGAACRTGTRSLQISRCTGRVTSTIRVSRTPRSSRSPRAPASTMCGPTTIASRRSCRRCSSISSRSRRPRRPRGASMSRAADRGRALFSGQARCSTCHVPPLYTEPGWAMHTGAEIGIDDFQASRAPDGRYRTTPLKGVWSHQKAASITTAASPPCCRSCSTTTSSSGCSSPIGRCSTWSNI